jgi:transcriptional regulator with XRE-family HTH domain
MKRELLRKDGTMRPVTITISENYTAELRERLENSDISLGALSREMSVDRSQVSRWLNSGVQPRLDTLLKIERAIAAIVDRRVIQRVLLEWQMIPYESRLT